MPASVLINGEWRPSEGSETFRAVNPATNEALPEEFPVSPLAEVEAAVEAAASAFAATRGWPGERFAAFLEKYAVLVDERAEPIATAANLESGLPFEPRLKNVELPRTTNQLRQAAAAAREGSWALPTIDTATGIRSVYGSLGPVAVFGPNNFPLAFNSIAGGDFAAAVAAGNPVIAKGHSSHPETTRLLAEAAREAAEATAMPAGFVQLIYRTSHADGEKLVSHPKLGATGYTGSRSAGLVLKRAADAAGKPIYLELSSINPVYILPGGLDERFDELVTEFTGSCLMGAGQFCTNPGVVILRAGSRAEQFVASVAQAFEHAPAGTLLSGGVRENLREGIAALREAGADVVTGDAAMDESRCCYANTLLQASGAAFLGNPEGLQAEAFGNASLFVMAGDDDEMVAMTEVLEGNLTGCIYSHTGGEDDALYDRIAPVLREKVGRLLNDKMPTGVAVSPAMNHGGPFPATGHPGFTAVGIPGSLRRFAMLQSYDAVRAHRLPPALQDKSPSPELWRCVDGTCRQGDVG